MKLSRRNFLQGGGFQWDRLLCGGMGRDRIGIPHSWRFQSHGEMANIGGPGPCSDLLRQSPRGWAISPPPSAVTGLERRRIFLPPK